MKITLHKYISREIWPTFLASLFVAVFVILATEMLSVTELIVNRGVYTGHVARMILYLLPDVVSFALPAAGLMAVVVSFLRLSADSEIIAMKSSGISLYQMLPPVLVFSLAGLVISTSVGMIAVPWGNRSFKDLIFQIGESKADLGIKERVFCEPFDNVVFYVKSFSSRERVMEDIFVVDRRDSQATNTIIAEHGRVVPQPKKRSIVLHFSDGTIFNVDKDLDSARAIEFKRYDLNIGLEDIMAALASRKKDPKEMSVRELAGELDDRGAAGKMRRNEIMIELMEKFAFPVAVFLMGVIGVPLGAQMRAGGRSAGIGVSLVVFLVYYICVAAMRSLCETGAVSPAAGVWIPDAFLVAAGVFLFRRAARERPLGFLFLFEPGGRTR